MPATILDGKKIAGEIQAEIKESISQFVAQNNQPPHLAAVLIGDDPASQVYIRSKERACARAGIASEIHRLDHSSTTTEVLSKIEELNFNPAVNGILVQLPLPDHIDTQRVLDAVQADKDVDAFHPYNVGLISQERPRYLPCTPHGIVQLLIRYQIQTQGRNVAIVGRSDIVGKPMAMMLGSRDIGLGQEYANATVTVCHSRTRELKEVTQAADILVAAIGKPKFITGDMLKPGAVVIDVGINRTETGLVGDVDFESSLNVASAITPVPGGVGPLTVTMLLNNTLSAAAYQSETSSTVA